MTFEHKVIIINRNLACEFWCSIKGHQKEKFTIIAGRRLRTKAVFGSEVNCPVKQTIYLQNYNLITFS